MYTLISTMNHSRNLDHDHYTPHVRNNLSPAWCHCTDAAEISRSEEALGNNTLFIFFYKQPNKFHMKNCVGKGA